MMLRNMKRTRVVSRIEERKEAKPSIDVGVRAIIYSGARIISFAVQQVRAFSCMPWIVGASLEWDHRVIYTQVLEKIGFIQP